MQQKQHEHLHSCFALKTPSFPGHDLDQLPCIKVVGIRYWLFYCHKFTSKSWLTFYRQTVITKDIMWQLSNRTNVLPITQSTVSKHRRKYKHWFQPVDWHHLVFIHHQMPDRRGTAPCDSSGMLVSVIQPDSSVKLGSESKKSTRITKLLWLHAEQYAALVTLFLHLLPTAEYS